jgi:UDP-glucose:glycoprotein glucosyltransferase
MSERNVLSGYGVFLDLKKMDYLALDDRHGQGGEQLNYFIYFAVDSLKMLVLIGTNGNDIAKDSTHTVSDENDHILPLLQKYPLNDSAVEANAPLTEDELLRMSGFPSLPLFCRLILTKPSHWLSIRSTNPRLIFSA